MSIEQEIDYFRTITEQMNEIFCKKRRDYGQTSTETYKKFGPISMYLRMYDKMGRLENLMVKGQKNNVGEAIDDTLLDLANYAIITIIERRKAEAEEKSGMIRNIVQETNDVFEGYTKK